MSVVTLHSETPDSLELDCGIMLYRAKSGRSVYATYHPARIVGGKPTLLAGKPATVSQLAAIAAASADQIGFRGFVPDRTVYIAPQILAWWVPAGRRSVWFKNDAAIGTRNGDAFHPPLLMVAKRNGVHIFAMRENERPGPDTPLYHAPYFNVYESGEMCRGNVKLPANPTTETIAAYEDAFFRSNFTHANHQNLIKRKGGATRLWRDLLDGAEFPLDCLVSIKRTAGQVIRQISGA
jgi:PRTRC genetic system protein B